MVNRTRRPCWQAHTASAVAVLARRSERPAPAPLSGLEDRLAATERPAPTITEYNQLLGQETAR